MVLGDVDFHAGDHEDVGCAVGGGEGFVSCTSDDDVVLAECVLPDFVLPFEGFVGVVAREEEIVDTGK